MTAQAKKPFDRRVLAVAAFLIVVVGGGIGILAYLGVSSKTVYIDKANVSAPQVVLAPTADGELRHTYVAVGDIIPANTVVAQVGIELIKSTSGGLVVQARTDIGASVDKGSAVVTTIDPSQLRVVGSVQEDKGLTAIKVGAPAEFTVDAFGGEKFEGTVEEISPTAQSGDVVFSVSDKREEQNFNVKVSFDVAAHPGLKNGMSAKLWIYKQ